jgi:acyl-CoA synthetase (AMP-forming)/AMP-acid ligase II
MAQALTLTGIDSHLEHSTLTTRKASDAIFQGPETSALKTINIGELLDQQRDTRPDKTAIISKWQGNRRVTYRQLHKECQDVAQSLLRLGVRPSDRVVVLAGNSLEYAQLFYAVSGIGAVFSIINPTVTTEEIVPAIEFLGT